MFKEIKSIILERKLKHKEDYLGIQNCWDRMIEILSENQHKTIDYLYSCSEEDLYYISEIFEDVALNLTKSGASSDIREYIDCLEDLNKKFPNLELERDINIAKSYINY